MTPHSDMPKAEVGIRELHDQLSRYVQHVQAGGQVVVTMRGRRVARLVPVESTDALAGLRSRGLVRDPETDRRTRRSPTLTADGQVSDLVGDQRR